VQEAANAFLTFVGSSGEARRQSSAVADVSVPARTATSQLPANGKFVAVGRVALDESVMSAVRHPGTSRRHWLRTTERCKDAPSSVSCQDSIYYRCPSVNVATP